MSGTDTPGDEGRYFHDNCGLHLTPRSGAGRKSHYAVIYHTGIYKGAVGQLAVLYLWDS